MIFEVGSSGVGSAGMGGWVSVLAAEKLLECRPLKVDVQGRSLVVLRHRGLVHAFENVCPHRGAPLDQGDVENDCLVCPLHGWPFELKTGRMPNTSHRLTKYEAREQDDFLQVFVPDEP